MSEVLVVLEGGATDQPVGDVAAAMAAVMDATVRRVDLTDITDITESTRKADLVLTELAGTTTVLGVMSGTASLPDLVWPVLQRAHKPVVLVPAASRPWPQMIGRALIPLNGSAESAAAIGETIQLLAYAGVDLVVLHVFDATTVPKFWDQAAHAEQAWQNEFRARYCDQPSVRLQLRTGVPGEHVLDVAAAEQVDLIALGWSQQIDEARAQTLRRTLHDAQVPVLVVPIATPP